MRVLRRWRFLAIALPVTLLALHPIDSADVWAQLATGRWIAAQHGVPHTDVFGQAAVPWLVHDWLAALLFFLLHRLAGASALVLCTTCITMAALLLPRWRGRHGTWWPYEIALLLTAGIAYERFFVRPEVFSLVAAAWWTQMLAHGGPRRARDLLVCGLVQIAWTNLHGAFLLGPALAALAVAGDLLERLLRRHATARTWSWPRLALPCTSLAACTITPYGPRLLASVLRAAGDLSGGALRAGVVEWQPTFSQPVAGDVVLMLFVASLVWVMAAAWVGRRAWRGFDVLAALAITVLACTARRQLAVYAVVVPPLAARWLSAWWEGKRAGRVAASQAGAAAGERGVWRLPVVRQLARVPRNLPACLAIAWSVAIGRGDFYAWAGPPRTVGLGIAAGTHPLGASEFTAQKSLPGPLFNNIAAGSALMWQLHGAPAVLVDGRLLDPVQFRTYRRCLESSSEFDAWTAQHGTQLVVLALQPFPPVQLFRHLEAAPGWHLVYFDAEGAVFVAREVARARGLSAVSLASALPAAGAPVGARGTWWRRGDAGEAALRGRLLLQLGSPAAGADLSRALLHCPHDRDLMLDLAAAWLRAGRTPEARSLVERVLREDHDSFPAWLALGACRAAEGNATEARRAWEQAARLRPGDTRPPQLLHTLPR